MGLNAWICGDSFKHKHLYPSIHAVDANMEGFGCHIQTKHGSLNRSLLETFDGEFFIFTHGRPSSGFLKRIKLTGLPAYPTGGLIDV